MWNKFLFSFKQFFLSRNKIKRQLYSSRNSFYMFFILWRKNPKINPVLLFVYAICFKWNTKSKVQCKSQISNVAKFVKNLNTLKKFKNLVILHPMYFFAMMFYFLYFNCIESIPSRSRIRWRFFVRFFHRNLLEKMDWGI
jgi:hypothetical protein